MARLELKRAVAFGRHAVKMRAGERCQLPEDGKIRAHGAAFGFLHAAIRRHDGKGVGAQEHE